MTVKQRVTALEEKARRDSTVSIAATILEARHAQPAPYTDAQLTEWAASKNAHLRRLAAANRRAPR